MNCELFDLKEMEVEHYQIREVLRCVLHTILFNRALGLVRPRDVDSGLFDITYVQCGDPVIEKRVEEKIDQLCSWVEKHPAGKGQVYLSFYEKRSKQMAWFSTKTDRYSWEQWCINFALLPPNSSGAGREWERTERRAGVESSLREVIFQVLRCVNESKDHIPPVLSSDIASFPFEITVPSGSDGPFGLDVIKRMLQSGSQTSVN